MNSIYVSREGYEKMQSELDELRKRKAHLSVEIGEAMAEGDLRENAGYTAAKERQAETLARIDMLEAKLKNCRLLDTLNVDKSEARIGATVTILSLDTDSESVYKLVGTEEADITEGRMSVESPLAQAILGRKAGDEFTAQLPKGPRKYRLLKLEYR